jgi:hypothetical protein
MASHDEELFEEVGGLLGSRPGWSLEAQSSPGAPRVWCFGAGGHNDLSVGVDGGRVDVYVVRSDQDLFFADAGQFGSWLEESESLFADRSSHSGHDFDRLLHAMIEEWRREGL